MGSTYGSVCVCDAVKGKWVGDVQVAGTGTQASFAWKNKVSSFNNKLVQHISVLVREMADGLLH